MKTYTISSFQPKVVYDEVMKSGGYQLEKKVFERYTTMNKEYYACYPILKKYERLIKKSKLHFQPGTMPIWGWHRDKFGSGFRSGSPALYKPMLKKMNQTGEEQMVVLFLEVPKEEVYLSNFDNWEKYLFSEQYPFSEEECRQWSQEQLGEYLADLAKEEWYFSRLGETKGNVRVQAIFPEIRKSMVTHVLRDEEPTQKGRK